MAFVHLHTHSQFSILDGTATVYALAKRAASLGMPALALTDSGNMYGAVAFYKACKGEGIKPVLGAELFVQPEGVQHRDPEGIDGGYQLIALIENDAGYKNLCKLITSAIFDGLQYKPRVDLEGIGAHSEGLIFLTGGLKGPLGKALAKGDRALAMSRLEALRERVAEGSLFLELCDLGLDGQADVNDAIREISRETGVPTVITNAVHYLDPEDSAALEVLNTISTGGSMSRDQRVVSPTDQAWLKPEAELAALFPHDADALARTVEIAERCNYAFDFDTYHFPATTPPDTGEGADTDANWEYFYKAFPPPRDYGLPDPAVSIPARPDGAGNISGYFRWYANEGLKLRLKTLAEAGIAHDAQAYWTQQDYEIDVILGMGFPAYLLIVAEFINWSKDNDIPVGPGRGSAAGSVAAWAMRITDIDPIRFGLVFERFLNPERVSMPDIDVDFCQDRREEAIEHVRQKYGFDYVSQIITYGTLKAKAAVRDVARVLDLNFGEADRIAKLVPEALGTTLTDALEQVELLRRMRDGDPKVRRVLDIALAVENTMRQTGVHAAGVVIADRPLVEYAPLYRDEPEGGPVVQYDMKSAESIGLIKFDFLGLKTLDQIRDAVKFVAENHGVELDMALIPVDDDPTYALLEEGDALGVFQLESSGMRNLLTDLKPNVIDDMVALVALYRPGPLQSGMTADFVERKHGRREVSYPLPMLEPILKSTYGTIIYQEQVMQIAQVMAGYSLGEADLLRRAMGKKNPKEMDQQRSRFVSGSVENRIDEGKANEIFDLMAKFAAYGFNKAHSAAYGWISYQTAYLKAHYRPEYMAALMTIEAANTDKVLLYVTDCRKAGIRILPVCVNHSMRHFSVPKPADRPVEDGAVVEVIRFGLAAVKNVGEGAIEAVVDAREKVGGHFRNAFAFFEALDYKRVNKRVLENLVKSGALDCFGMHRSALYDGIEAAVQLAVRRQEDEAAGQTSLFAAMAPKSRPVDFRFPDRVEWPLSLRLGYEREVLGLYLTGHPMQAHENDVRRYATTTIHELDPSTRDEVRILGLVGDSRVMKTRSGDKMAFVVLEEPGATMECVFGPEVWSTSQRAVLAGEPVLVTGTVDTRREEPQIRVSSCEPLSEVRARTTGEVWFNVEKDELLADRLDPLKEILAGHRGGCRARLVVQDARWEVELRLPEYPIEPSAQMEERVNALFGRAVVTLR
ncbi:MAG: DNA polymerase III subunit alpha [Alphaproteobacteria bacterium]|nr:DNA polymerase III subunit alpha [Alphaproteobacteria bacterium]